MGLPTQTKEYVMSPPEEGMSWISSIWNDKALEISSNDLNDAGTY